MFWHKKAGQRMYFQIHHTNQNLKNYINPDDDTLKVKLANGEPRADCRIMLRTDKWSTITTNCSEFCNVQTSVKEISTLSVSRSPQSVVWFSSCIAFRWTLNNDASRM